MFSREKRLFKKLASADASFKTTLARDATAPAAVLERLAQEDLVDIRRVVAENASTGTETLFLLSHDADRGVRDKALERLLELSGNAKASRVLRDSAASPRLIASIAEDLSWSDVRELCGNGYDWDDRHGEFPEPSAPLLTELARVRNARVREEVAKSKHATAVILASLARDADEGVRFAVASNASTPPQTLATLLSDTAVRVRKQTLTNANLPIEALSAAVADENAEVRQQLAATTSASNGTLNQLANDESAGVRCAVARNPASPDRLLDRLSVDPEKEVRLAVALAAAPVVLFGAMTTVKNYARETPLEALSNLSADADPEVRRAAASHPRLPLETFYRLANDPDESVRNHAASVIEHGYRYPRPEQSYSTYGQEKEPSDFPTSALPALAASPHDAIRKAVARHPLIPARLLAQLLDDGRVFDQDFSDRDKPWSSRTLMPFAVLNDLSWDTTEEWMTLAQVANPQARQTLAFSSGTPSAVLTLLATDEVEYVREGLLENHQLPAAALRKLVDDPSPAVAKKAASLLAQQTWRFRDDLGVFLDANNEKARATLARDESARREWLESLSQDPSALVRAAVAGNSNTSPTVLESLSADADPAVSSALEGAVKGGALSLESLEAVAASPHPPIRAAVASKPGLTSETLRRLGRVSHMS